MMDVYFKSISVFMKYSAYLIQLINRRGVLINKFI